MICFKYDKYYLTCRKKTLKKRKFFLLIFKNPLVTPINKLYIDLSYLKILVKHYWNWIVVVVIIIIVMYKKIKKKNTSSSIPDLSAYTYSIKSVQWKLNVTSSPIENEQNLKICNWVIYNLQSSNLKWWHGLFFTRYLNQYFTNTVVTRLWITIYII